MAHATGDPLASAGSRRPQGQDNMKLWNAVCTTPPEHTKQVNQRGGFTAICAQYQIQVATELWGPYGSSWGMKDTEWHYVRSAANDIIEVTLDATFWYPGGAFEISSDAAYRPGNDSRKKILTDATTKALSKLGFSADVFLGLYDDNKYVQSLREQHSSDPPPDEPPPPPEIPADVQAIKNKAVELFGTPACLAAVRAMENPPTDGIIVTMAQATEWRNILNATIDEGAPQ